MKKKVLFFTLLLSLIFIFGGCNGTVSEIKYKKGTFNTESNTYISEFFGVKVVLDKDWTGYNNQQMAQLNGITDFSDKNLLQALKDKGTVFDLYAVMSGNLTGTNLNITVQDLRSTNSLKFTEETYIDNSIETIKKGYEDRGATVEQVRKENLNFAGKDRFCSHYKILQNDAVVYLIQVAVKKGDYMATITISSSSDQYAVSTLQKFESA